MESNYRFPASPGTPLFQASAERVNQQRKDVNASPSNGGHSRDSSVFEKVARFDSLASQSKALERKTNDAALKRAMLGREEAETEMHRYRDEARMLRKQLEDGKERERKVGERLETVMENYGRAKETHAHTQTLWEKEIRRARKESFKSQSVLVKLQEELKSARNSLRMTEQDFERERERSSKREQEAFAARYQLVGIQEDLANMIDQVKLVEQERDALKTIARNEEIARIAAEGRIPLPSSKNDDDEFASPRKVSQSLAEVTVKSSVASEEEIEQLRSELAWERKKADRAYELSQYLQVECQFKCCSCRKSESKGDEYVFVPSPLVKNTILEKNSSDANEEEDDQSTPVPQERHYAPELVEQHNILPPGPIFIPAEGVFRSATPEESPWISPAKPVTVQPIPPFQHAANKRSQPTPRIPSYSRTPSCEPPTSAIVFDTNTSLLSLIDGSTGTRNSELEETIIHHEQDNTENALENPSPVPQYRGPSPIQTFHTISTTIKIPLAAPIDKTPPTISSVADALSPTMSREEALAQIRERRGRARSLAQGTLTPRKPIMEGVGLSERRDCSAPAVRSGAVRGRDASRI